MGDFIPTYSTDNIWREENMEQCLSTDLNTIESNITALQSGKANTSHTHTDYAAVNHTHTGYAVVDHTHTGYATVDHTHTGYASSEHTHSYNDLTNKPTIPTSLPANGGNSDTVDGKHANEFATVSDVSTLQALVGDTSVSQQISNAISEIIYNQVIFIDQITGYKYVVEVKNGALMTNCRCTEINITTLPDRTAYVAEEGIDTTGMVVEATCEDGSTRIIENYTCSAVIDGIVTVSYTECGTTYTDTFTASIITIEELLVDFTYTTNSNGTYTITGWKETLNGSPSTECIIPNSTLIKL